MIRPGNPRGREYVAAVGVVPAMLSMSAGLRKPPGSPATMRSTRSLVLFAEIMARGKVEMGSTIRLSRPAELSLERGCNFDPNPAADGCGGDLNSSPEPPDHGWPVAVDPAETELDLGPASARPRLGRPPAGVARFPAQEVVLQADRHDRFAGLRVVHREFRAQGFERLDRGSLIGLSGRRQEQQAQQSARSHQPMPAHRFPLVENDGEIFGLALPMERLTAVTIAATYY